jgi:hypothetical protein
LTLLGVTLRAAIVRYTGQAHSNLDANFFV